MVSNKKEANTVKARMYPPDGYRSYGPIRGLVYGGPDYADKANAELLKFAMIETKESIGKFRRNNENSWFRRNLHRSC